MTMILQPTSTFTICKVFVRHLLLVVRFECALRSGRRSIISFTCSSFGSSKRSDWWRCTGSYTNRLRGIRVVFVLLPGVVGPRRSWSRFCDGSDLRKGTIATSVRSSRYGSWLGTVRCESYTRVWSSKVGVENTGWSSRWRSRQLWLWQSLRGGVGIWSSIVQDWR